MVNYVLKKNKESFQANNGAATARTNIILANEWVIIERQTFSVRITTHAIGKYKTINVNTFHRAQK